MGNALFYGACGFGFCIFSACLGVFLGKVIAWGNPTMSYEEMDGIEGQWNKEPPS